MENRYFKFLREKHYTSQLQSQSLSDVVKQAIGKSKGILDIALDSQRHFVVLGTNYAQYTSNHIHFERKGVERKYRECTNRAHKHRLNHHLLH